MMAAEMIAEINAAHDHLEVLEHQCRFVEADAFFEANRAIFDYDREGNWTGIVANENGWVA